MWQTATISEEALDRPTLRRRCRLTLDEVLVHSANIIRVFQLSQKLFVIIFGDDDAALRSDNSFKVISEHGRIRLTRGGVFGEGAAQHRLSRGSDAEIFRWRRRRFG